MPWTNSRRCRVRAEAEVEQIAREEGAMDDDDAARLIAGSRLIAGDLDQLRYALSRLRPDQSGYITAEDYERITGEELDEFSTEGRKTMADLAAQHGCTIRTPPIEQRVYFTKR